MVQPFPDDLFIFIKQENLWCGKGIVFGLELGVVVDVGHIDPVFDFVLFNKFLDFTQFPATGDRIYFYAFVLLNSIVCRIQLRYFFLAGATVV